MKVSLRWIFNHINANIADISITDLVERFIKTTAEIESWSHVRISVETLTLAQLIENDDTHAVLFSPEKNKKYTLQKRADGVVSNWYLLDIANEHPAWATMLSVGGTKEAVLPALYSAESMRAGEWKKHVEYDDYILEIDNKSINHRPDLWGHRGIAREIAALFNFAFFPADEYMVTEKQLEKSKNSSKDFTVAISAPDACDYFSLLSVDVPQSPVSALNMALRLSRIDSKPISFLVDCTNYVMFDLGQPMHAFDKNTVVGDEIVVRYARAYEKLATLDGTSLTLTSQDLIIAQEDTPLSLAGVIGGAATGVTAATISLLLEAAHFDPAVVRRGAARHKIRTESSMRFEKNRDAASALCALRRYLFLLHEYNIDYQVSGDLVVVGNLAERKKITVEHAFIENKIGVELNAEHVCATLKKLGFDILMRHDDNGVVYEVEVPSFRAKDIAIAEDIVEEVGRYTGYDSIPVVMPSLPLRVPSLTRVRRERKIKEILSNGLSMKELYLYSFFDEPFLKQLSWNPENTVALKHPLSENATRMVSSLQPHLLKSIKENCIHHQQLRFFELARTWTMHESNMIEKKSLAGIFFDQHKQLDFYEGKALMNQFFDALRFSVSWSKNEDYHFSWLSVSQSAQLTHNGVIIGCAGMVKPALIEQLLPCAGSVFIFELFDADALINYQLHSAAFKPLAKYPSVWRDISVLLPESVTTERIEQEVKQLDGRVRSLELVDFFSKPEWHGKKALTFRIELYDNNKTLEHAEIESLWANITSTFMRNYNAEIR